MACSTSKLSLSAVRTDTWRPTWLSIAALLMVLSLLVPGHSFMPAITLSRSVRLARLPSCLAAPSKWDNLVDEDDEEEQGPPIPPDMRYIPRNVNRQHQNFVAMRQAGGPDVTADVYVREPQSNVFWFVGKVSFVGDVRVEQAVARQWSLIETHAANLRPLELFPARGELEIWTAPGDSELEVAYSRPSVVFSKINRDLEGAARLKNNLVGFQGEVYERGEEGFRTLRDDQGRPLRPEIQRAWEESDTRPPTDEEMAQLEKALEGMDINELYEEQQQREGNPRD